MDPPQAMALRADIPGADQASTSLIAPRSTQVTMGAPLNTSLIQDADGFTILGGQFTSASGDVTVHNHYPHSELALGSISTEYQSEIYYSQLLRQKRGFPLYDPQAPSESPSRVSEEWCRNRRCWQDHSRGGIRLFFQCISSADHPIHNHNVPEDFSPLPLYDTLDLYDQSYFADSIQSKFWHYQNRVFSHCQCSIFPGGDFLLSCLPPQGAVLALPHGSHLQKLDNLQNLRKIRCCSRRELVQVHKWPQGTWSRRLIIPCHWLREGLIVGACIISHCRKCIPALVQAHHWSRGYRWRGNPARKKYHDPSLMHDLNQTMFIHGLPVQIREISGNGSQPGSEGGSSTSSSEGSSLFSPICHPGQLLNNYILEKHPQAAVVMSHDDDWGEILGDACLPSDDPASYIRTVPEFLQRINAQYEVMEKDGATFLQAMPGDDLATWSKIALPELGPQQSSDLPSDSHRHHDRIIPPEEDMQRLFQECKIGVENANLLAEAVAMATPEQLNDSVIVELHKKCVDSQELIFTQLPWAAEYSRKQAEEKKRERVRTGKSSSNTLNWMNPDGNGSVPDLSLSTPVPTVEELLAVLLASNEQLLEAIKLFDDLKRAAGERDVENRSQREVRMDPRVRPASKWKLSFGKSSASALERVSPVEEASPDTLVPPTLMSATASNVSSLIMGLDLTPPPSASADERPRGRLTRLSVPPDGFSPAKRPNRERSKSSRSPHPGSEHWDADHRTTSPNSMRRGRPIASSVSSMVSGVSGSSGNRRSSVSPTSSAGTSTSAFTQFSNASVRSISTTATSVAAQSWRPALSSNNPKNIKIMNGVPWELDQLPRGQYPDPVRQPRTRKPKDLQLGTIPEPLRASEKSPDFQRRDAASSTTDLSVPESPREEDGDGPKYVSKAQINALDKMLSALRR
ncbi:hypothetical protein B0H14DRAFT_2922184 [Mycena olivaceomarginata]|nr:hypothetical protein B0H14DRAFT_2922184 [Mycena olivaceomarginata]